MSPRRARALVGWREWVALPDLGVDAVKAKVDTGAATSALHAWDVHVDQADDGHHVVSFSIHPVARDDSVVVPASAPLVGWRTVRSSNGTAEERPVVATTVVLGAHRWTTELTLTRRDEMGFRMLLGRAVLRRRFVVDPSASYREGRDRVAPL